METQLEISNDRLERVKMQRSIDSFIAGFHLAWCLSNKLNIQERTRPMLTPRGMVAGMDAFIDAEN